MALKRSLYQHIRQVVPLRQRLTFGGLLLLIALANGLSLSLPVPLLAHGALLKYTHTAAITVQAVYDTGQSMTGAQITVYAPDNPARPWLTGISDAEGRFSFVPDPDLPGTWSVRARHAGHGAMVHIPINPEQPEHSLRKQGYTAGQRALMAASVVWGCIGTALYFSRRRTS
ncbi:carboxypeptidase-like regulatory domain-containing protein [Desulfobulbus alkaliphilus]|uniref:carboxypeptidase-like regulatory domain-containing protein n=1 Tax=Desulfobulbus alkaliphilus TaxID=869814 RepID=UPI001965A98E|nr:carboxypeptidase-like regulatory domain-containing protein [Desulfobulbus alkaliphilus]MBM9536075.1 carboxypeptidase regulatory-like domain-containing protein [Desulfobulbus alkaliphilus]